MQLMVVDDSAMVRERLAGLLCGIDGVQAVLQADCGQQAMALLQQDTAGAVRFIVLDIEMPGESGCKFCSASSPAGAISAWRCSPSTPTRSTARAASMEAPIISSTRVPTSIGSKPWCANWPRSPIELPCNPTSPPPALTPP